MDPFGLTTPREFFTEGYENIGWNPYTWYYHCNYGGADNPVGIGDPDHVPRPFIDALDRQAYYPHDRRYSKARADGLTFSGQLWRQGWADMMLAGRLWSQSWRWTSEDGLTGLHGQIHGTLAAVWFPIQSTGQLAVGTVVRAGEWIWSVGRRVVRPVKMKERIKNV